jgi:DNA-binding MarR family transcriptional regulator
VFIYPTKEDVQLGNPHWAVRPSVDKTLWDYVMSRDGPGRELNRSTIHLLHRAGQCASDVFQGEMSGDLTPRQYVILSTVAQHEGLSQTHLVERTGIDRSTLADVIRRMLRKGLLQRRRTRDDARAYAVKLTEEGWRILKAAEPLARRADEKILAALPNSDRDRFIKGLSQIVRNLNGTFQ